MIGLLLDRLSGLVDAADAVRATEEVLAVSWGPGRSPAMSRTEATGWHLRVQREGRVGLAGASDDGLDALAERAVESATGGPALTLHLPAPAPLPAVRTFSPAAGALGPRDLIEITRHLGERLDGPGRSVTVWAERTASRIDVANTRGVLAGYHRSMVGLGALVAVGEGPGALRCELHRAAVDPPDLEELARLVEEAETRVRMPPPAGTMEEGEQVVGLAPRAVASLLASLDRMFRAPPSPDLRLSRGLSIVDDPLVDGRVGSRPIDDEAVVSRRVVLADDGDVVGWRCDLQSGAVLGLPSTGHGVRQPFAPSRIGPSNTCLLPGPESLDDLPARVGNGIVVLDIPGGTGRTMGGRGVATPWACRVEGGKITGRLERLVLRATPAELLQRVVAVGNRVEWTGAISAPALLLQPVRIASRG